MVFIFWSPIPKKERESTPEISIFFFRTAPNQIKNPQFPQVEQGSLTLKLSVS
tara:strand:+ start:105 stop:263 length:159 start_codon:yes stop_codon:yes gene_type:complete